MDNHDHNCKDDCLEIFMILSEYLDQELTTLKCSQIEEHMRRCERCTAFFESFSLTVKLSRKLECHEFFRIHKEVRKKLHNFLKERCNLEGDNRGE